MAKKKVVFMPVRKNIPKKADILFDTRPVWRWDKRGACFVSYCGEQYYPQDLENVSPDDVNKAAAAEFMKSRPAPLSHYTNVTWGRQGVFHGPKGGVWVRSFPVTSPEDGDIGKNLTYITRYPEGQRESEECIPEGEKGFFFVFQTEKRRLV
jgi:hypothetical protein